MKKRIVTILIPLVALFAVITIAYQGQKPYIMAGQAAAAATVGINVNAVGIPAATASFIVNWLNGPYARVSASASPTAAYTVGDLSFTNPIDGNVYVFEWDQDATGEALTFPSVVVAPGGVNAAPTIPKVANGVDVVTMIYNAAANKYFIQSITSNQAQTNVHNNCVTTVTLSSGVFTTTGAGACFTQYSQIGWLPFGGGTPGTAATPTATTIGTQSRVQCWQSAANSQTITCVSASPQDAQVVQVYGVQ